MKDGRRAASCTGVAENGGALTKAQIANTPKLDRVPSGRRREGTVVVSWKTTYTFALANRCQCHRASALGSCPVRSLALVA